MGPPGGLVGHQPVTFFIWSDSPGGTSATEELGVGGGGWEGAGRSPELILP